MSTTSKERAEAAVHELRARWPQAASIRNLVGNNIEVLFGMFGHTRLKLWRYITDDAGAQWACEATRHEFTAEADGDTATTSAEAGLRALAALIRADADAVEVRAAAEVAT